jgi:hypothetical protein
LLYNVIMKKYFIGTFLLTLLVLSTNVLAQSTNWADYGLTERDVQFLSEKEKQEILNSRTPDQTEEYYTKGLQDGSINPENLPPLLQYLPNEINVQPPNDNINNNSELPLVSNPEVKNNIANAPVSKLSEEVVSCFDFYTFGSIETPIQSRTSNTTSGADMIFFGEIINNNSYPIVEGTLYVKIFKNIGSVKNPNGPDVVDQFIAVDNVTVPANGSIPIEFKWKVPAYATTGEYRVVTYFTSDKKFNLQGLSFTDDIVGNSFDFKVSGGQEESITFDKSSVVINDSPYYFAAYPPRITNGQSANISLEILNNTNTDQDAQIKWKLYKWDTMHPDNLVREFNTNTETKADSKTKLELSIPEDSEPVYLLVGELSYQDTKSIVNIRFVRDGVDKVRLNYPAVTNYPLNEGEQTTLFTCLHNSGQSPQVQDNKVILEVRDENGKVVESYTYEGAVTGEMMAVKKDFTPKTTLNKFTVHASVYTNGELVDESIMEYDCSLIDPSKCLEEKSSFSFAQIIIGISSIILLIIILVLLKRKTKGVELVVLLFVAIVSVLIFDINVPKSGAQNDAPLPSGYVNPNITSGSSQAIWSETINKLLFNVGTDGQKEVGR